MKILRAIRSWNAFGSNAYAPHSYARQKAAQIIQRSISSRAGTIRISVLTILLGSTNTKVYHGFICQTSRIENFIRLELLANSCLSLTLLLLSVFCLLSSQVHAHIYPRLSLRRLYRRLAALLPLDTLGKLSGNFSTAK